MNSFFAWLRRVLAQSQAQSRPPKAPVETPPPVVQPPEVVEPPIVAPPVVVQPPPKQEQPPREMPPPAPPNFKFPVDVVGKGWKVTLESGKDVSLPDLRTYSDENFRLSDDGRGAQMRVHFGSGTTPNSSNPRCEWREMTPDGKKLASWSTTSGRHVMVATFRPDRHCEARKHLVVAQIHDGEDDVTVFRLEDTTLWITNGDTTHAYRAASNLQLGTIHTVGFDVSNGVISYMLDGVMLPYKLPAKKTGCYFKHGAYLQANKKTAPKGTKEMYAQVTTFALSATHSGV